MKQLSDTLTAIADDARGEVVVESMVALSFLLLLFVAVCQVVDGYAHQLLVRRAASAAARAAIVVLPDDGAHYGDRAQRTVNQLVEARKRAIDDAAHAVLSGSSSFTTRGTTVTVSGGTGPAAHVTTTVEADYTCLLPLVNLLCGSGQTLRLRASASLPSQFASYRYARGG